MAKPLLVLNVVGLTPRHVGEHTPALATLGGDRGARPMRGVMPAVTCPAQATMLTGQAPAVHGIVGNGWLYRDTREIRFWQQSRALIEAPTLYDAARERARARGEDFTCAKLLWWFNQGADVDWSLTPKPYYGCDGRKAFGIHGRPEGFPGHVAKTLGPFPFHTFWGPMAGLPCTDWIADAAALILKTQTPTLTLCYLPHLDYDLQRHGATGPHVAARLREVDAAAGRVIAAAREVGATVMVVSEYGLCDVSKPVYLNRVLRENGWLHVRDGPFGENLETFQSRAFAVVDHQVAHVYVADKGDVPQVRELLEATPGVERVLADADEPELAHARTGELIALAEARAWFAYPFWLDETRAPDYARCIDIHRKPGYDPAELFFDPDLWWPKAEVAWSLLKRRLGLRARMDIVPLRPELVRGSHGLAPADPMDGPVFLSDAHDAPPVAHQRDVMACALTLMGLGA